MPSGGRKQIPTDSLLHLRQRLDRLPIKSPERASQVAVMAHLYGVSPTTVYRALHRVNKPHAAHRADHGKPRLLPASTLAGDEVRLAPPTTPVEIPRQPFDAEAHEYHYPTIIAAKLAIADELATPLAKLTADDRAYIDQLLAETRTRRVVLARIREYFRSKKEGQHAC